MIAGHNLPMDVVLVNAGTQSYKTRTLYLRQSKFEEIQSVGDLPKELANVPFLLELKDESRAVKESLNMEFWAGFMEVR